ncbi:MAG: zinc finger CCHC domain-containing protein, partial [Sedimenticola sp.]
CGWDDQEKTFRLIGGLRGEAADFVFNQLSPEIQACYDDLEHALASRFRERRTATSFLAELENRKLSPREKLIEYASDIKRLVRRSYPTADNITVDTISLRYFLKGLGDQQMVLAVGMKNPGTIDEACEILETYKSLRDDSPVKPTSGPRIRAVQNAKGPRFVTEGQFSDFKGQLQTNLDKKHDEIISLVKDVTNGEKERVRRREWKKRDIATVECYKCHELGHYANECPARDGRVPQHEDENNRGN